MTKIIVEVGSTVTKADLFDGNKIERIKEITIEFKKNFLKNNCLDKNDVQELICFISSIKNLADEIFVCGTSIFRTLANNDRIKLLNDFKVQTGCDFNIISQEQESEYTVKGATRFVKCKACIMIGGGGSTEIAIYDNGIKEDVNTKFGVIDVMHEFPDLAEDFAKTNIEEVMAFVKSKINLPKEKADVLILAGGAHEKFARFSGIKYDKNTLYEDEVSPIMMDIELRKIESKRYYESISLDEIRSRAEDPKWWYATRAMCAVVLVVAEAVGAKYIVPTDISMVYGLIGDNKDTMKNEVDEFYEDAVRLWGEEAQIRMCIEEMSELTKELCKFLRYTKIVGQASEEKIEEVKQNIIEETADVLNSATQIANIFGKKEVEEIKIKKVKRTILRLEEYRNLLGIKRTTLLYVVKDGKVLLGKKLRGFGTGKYNGAGGKVEQNETIEQAMIRETQEEFGIVPKDYKHVGNIFYDEFKNSEKVYFDTAIFVANDFDGKIQTTDEMQPIWFEVKNLPYDEMFGDDIFWLPQVLDGKRVNARFVFDEKFNIISKAVSFDD